MSREQVAPATVAAGIDLLGWTLPEEDTHRLALPLTDSELRRVVAGLTEDVILVEPDQRIIWANEAALAMYGAAELVELGATVDAYRSRFSLRDRNNRLPDRHPIERVVRGETFHDVLVDVSRTDRPDVESVHALRSLVATDAPSCLALILQNVPPQFEAEERFEKTFNANPVPAVIILAVLQDISERKRSERDLFTAIQAVMADTSWFSRGLIEKFASLRHPGDTTDADPTLSLTVRERQRPGPVCTGLGDEAIAKRLGLSRNTVRNHTAALHRKLGLHKRSEVIVWGRERGFPTAPPR